MSNLQDETGYTLRFGRHLLLKTGTRLQCIEARKVSGDLVYTPNGEIDTASDWLWPWEQADPQSHARRVQANKRHYEHSLCQQTGEQQ